MRAIIYLRVSKESKYATNGQSLGNQLERCKMYCELKGLEVVDVIEDDGVSGFKTDNRKGYVEVMEYVENKETDAIVVYSLSRFMRNTRATLEAIELMAENNVQFHSLTESIDTSSAAGKLFLTMIAGFAEFERNITGERTKSVLDAKRSRGEALGSIPYGFKREGKMLVEDEYEGYVVKSILKWADEGKGLSEIVSLCEQHELRSRSGKWHRQTISNIIESNKVKV